MFPGQSQGESWTLRSHRWLDDPMGVYFHGRAHLLGSGEEQGWEGLRGRSQRAVMGGCIQRSGDPRGSPTTDVESQQTCGGHES